MPLCGNQEVQVQMTVALDPLDETNLKCERVARECYDAGLHEAMKPGMKFAEMVAVMEEPLGIGGMLVLHAAGAFGRAAFPDGPSQRQSVDHAPSSACASQGHDGVARARRGAAGRHGLRLRAECLHRAP